MTEYTIQTELGCGVYLDKGDGKGRENEKGERQAKRGTGREAESSSEEGPEERA